MSNLRNLSTAEAKYKGVSVVHDNEGKTAEQGTNQDGQRKK